MKASEYPWRPLSLSGIPMGGNRIVRTIYLDESGTSAQDPVAVVCGVIIDADRQWEPIEAYMKELINEFVPADIQPGFVFHAKYLFHGCFARKQPPNPAAREALKRILGIPWEFGIPFAFGFHRKSDSGDWADAKPRDKIALHHAMAYSFCAVACEQYMREHARPNEIATMVAENVNDAKSLTKGWHSLLQGNHRHSQMMFRAISKDGKNLPIRKIKDTVHFAEKDGALFMQLADAFGFIFRGFLEGRDNADEFVEALLVSPDDFKNLRELPAGGRLVRQELAPELQNPFLIPPRIWSTIPGYGEILPPQF